MSRPYDYLPMISQEIAAQAAGFTDQANVDYFRERQPRLTQRVIQPQVGQYGNNRQLHLDSLGLIYRAIDIGFAQDIGGMFSADRLPSISPPELYVDVGLFKQSELTASQLEDDFRGQQTDNTLDRRLLAKWNITDDPLLLEAKHEHAKKTMITGGFIMWLADKTAQRFVEHRSE